MRKILLLIAYFFIFTVCLCGCKFAAKNQIEEITVNFPQWESSLPKFSRWKVQIISENIDETFFTTENSVTIETQINEPLSVLVTPIVLLEEDYESDFFKPAGAIYPYFVENGILNATWECGFSSLIMAKLFYSGKESGITKEHLNEFIRKFNWKKFESTIEEKIAKSVLEFGDESVETPKLYNPWFINEQKLLENLCMGIFETSYLNLSYVYSVKNELLGLEKNQINSSFVLENQIISDYGKVLLQKNNPQIFYVKSNYGINVNCKSAKKVSVDIVYMPIFLNEL